MDFQKAQNNNPTSRRMMMLMREMAAQKGVKYEEEEQQGSDDNLGGEEEDETMEKSEAEEKKQKRVLASGGRRSVGGGNSSVSCQAEKCTADLTDAKRYHRRHKVCEFHAKAPSVVVSGLRQRFCQQCSRFHDVSEFDEAKRSCRRRLAGHNERRRKSSSEPQGERGSSRSKAAASPQCRPADHEKASRLQMSSSYPASNPTFKHYQIR